MHYGRMRDHGEIGPSGIRSGQDLPLADLFDLYFAPEELPDGCIRQTKGQVSANGYPVMTFQGKSLLGNRAALWLVSGDPGRGMLACHTCDHRWCLAPGHLYWGTYKSNGEDRANRNPMKVDPEKVKAARRMLADGQSIRTIEREVGISRASIKRHLGLPLSPSLTRLLPKNDPCRIAYEAAQAKGQND